MLFIGGKYLPYYKAIAAWSNSEYEKAVPKPQAPAPSLQNEVDIPSLVKMVTESATKEMGSMVNEAVKREIGVLKGHLEGTLEEMIYRSVKAALRDNILEQQDHGEFI